MNIEEISHQDLVLRAEKWLKQQGCGVVFRDPFKAVTSNGEQPDAIGWRCSASILIECKTSRADFHADKKKSFRQFPEKGMGEWRFYMCLPDVIKIEDLPEKWGLLYVVGNRVKKVHGVPSNCQWYQRPFESNQSCEMQLMYSALRRMHIRGHLNEIYNGLPSQQESL